jgi:phosphoketolase
MSERGEIKRMNATAHKNSGRGNIQKADASWENFIVDIKEAGKSFNLTTDVWGKIVTDQMKTNVEKYPALKLVIGEKHKVRLAVIEWAVLEELVENARPDSN